MHHGECCGLHHCSAFPRTHSAPPTHMTSSAPHAHGALLWLEARHACLSDTPKPYPARRGEEGSARGTCAAAVPGRACQWGSCGVWAEGRRAAAAMSRRQPAHRSVPPSSPREVGAWSEERNGRGSDTGQSSTARIASPARKCPSSPDPARTLLTAISSECTPTLPRLRHRLLTLCPARPQTVGRLNRCHSASKFRAPDGPRALGGTYTAPRHAPLSRGGL